MNNTHEKGVTLYLAMLIMSAALATALFVASVFVREFRITKDTADSMRAVYVADSAMEYSLYQARVTKDFSSFSSTGGDFLLQTTACASTVLSTMTNVVCNVDVSPSVSLGTIPGCPAAPNCTATDCTHITTKGAYGTTNRAMEIVYPSC